MGKLDGKVALVTGAGTGIGQESAILLAREGATVVLAGRRIEPLEDVAAEIKKQGGHAIGRSLDIEVFEHNVPPRFRIKAQTGLLPADDFTIETTRPDGGRQLFGFEARDGYLESRDEIPEPHAFRARIRLMQAGKPHERELEFVEHDHEHGAGAHHRDNNMRAAVLHVMADAAVSVLVIIYGT